ncbi:MAG: hypothetical protein KJS97_06025 [Alphaproteobacteria bacterium]|nr:hypothetical protein [Alphaproteobacteria bacterium]
MSNRSRGPRWGLLGAAVAIVAAVAALAAATLRGTDAAAGASVAPGLSLYDVLEIVSIIGILACAFVVPIMVVAAFLLPPRRDADPTWRRHLDLYKTQPALARRTPGPAAARVCAKLSDDTLRVAAILPAHSAEGQAVAAAELQARGRPLEPIPDVRVPSFYAVEDLPQARRSVTVAHRIRMICGAGGALLLVTAFVLIGVNKFAVEPLMARATEAGLDAGVAAALNDLRFEDLPERVRAWPEMANILVRDVIAKASVALMIPFALIYFFASWLRARPVRVLMLRKFNDRRLGKVYNRLISSELQHFGHVIALADKHVRRSTFAWLGGILMRSIQSIPNFFLTVATLPVLLLLRATDRTRWGPAFVAAPRDFRLLAKRLFDRLELNTETTFVSKGYLVRTTDAWWRLVVRLMMDSADVIVLDASYVTEGTAWEIETLLRLDLWGRVVRLSLESEQEAAQAALANAPPGPIFAYDGTGAVLDRPAFTEAVFAALEHSVHARAG